MEVKLDIEESIWGKFQEVCGYAGLDPCRYLEQTVSQLVYWVATDPNAWETMRQMAETLREEAPNFYQGVDRAVGKSQIDKPQDGTED